MTVDRTITKLAPQGLSAWRQTICSPLSLSLLLGLVTLLVYLPVRHNDYVNYDDGDYVFGNRHVQSGLTSANVGWAFTTGAASNWHPLTWVSHMLDAQVFGNNPGPQHLVSLGLHVANTLLLFWVLRAMTGALFRSAIVAALFALHPLHVESVAWISERKDVLSTFFFLLTIRAYVAYTRSARGEVGRASLERSTGASGFALCIAYYLLSLVLFALGLMSKPMLVTTPFVLLLLDVWPLGRTSIVQCRMPTLANAGGSAQSPGSEAKCNTSLIKLLLEKLPFLALSVVSSYVTFLVQRKGGSVSTSISIAARLANASISYARYLGKTFWPLKLSVLYPHPGHWPGWQVAGATGLVLAISAAVIVLGRRRPYLPVGWFWFLGTLVPVIGLVQVGVQSMADRYTYIPLIGVFIILVWGTEELSRSFKLQAANSRETPTSKRGQATVRSVSLQNAVALTSKVVVVVLLLFACALCTGKQIGYWRNGETLFEHATRSTDGNYLAYNNLGFYLSGKGKTAEAMENYRKSLQINPRYEDALNNYGFGLASEKKYSEAIGYYEAALRVRDNQPDVHNNLGNALSEMGQGDAAMAQYIRALQLNPEHADAHNNLGIALAMRGRLDEAIEHFHQAIRYKPDYASAHSNLGNALAVQRKFDEAITEYRQCLKLKPEDSQAHNNLANALAEKGLLNEALTEYEQALRLNAANPEAHFNLGIALARLGRHGEAVAHYREALRLKPDYAEARKQLAAEGQGR